MKFYNRFRNGVNLGGWLSQYVVSGTRERHYKTFIMQEDIKIISGWGADHIRLPVDYEVIERSEAPRGASEEGLAYIDSCLEWCEKQGLNVVLDLHKAPGQVYGYDKNPNPLLVEEEYQSRYTAIWSALAKRYRGMGDTLAFELLNEITDATGYLWNRLYPRIIEAIRREDAGRVIIVGSNDANSVFTLKEMHIPDDPSVVYNFHYYDPLVFTHQRAHFSKDMVEYDREILYPGEIPALASFLYEKPEYVQKLGRYAWEKNDRKLMEKYLDHAANFMKYTGKQLYCGEFGVIGTAPSDSALRWVRDLTEILDSLEIGHAYWSYKEMDFGLVDINRHIVDEALVGQLFGK